MTAPRRTRDMRIFTAGTVQNRDAEESRACYMHNENIDANETQFNSDEHFVCLPCVAKLHQLVIHELSFEFANRSILITTRVPI